MPDWMPYVYLMFVLKIPVGMLLYLVYWAAKQSSLPEEAPETGEDHGFRRWNRPPPRPRGPRRGPHAPDALPLPDCPPAGRVRMPSAPAPVRAAGSHGPIERGRAEH